MADCALALYRGLFLPTDLCEDWSRAARGRYQRLWAMLVRHVASQALREQRFGRAILLLDKLIAAAPEDESAVRLAMIAHASAGQRHEALQLYQALCEQMSEALAARPGAQVRALHAAIQSGASAEELLAGFL